MRKFSVTVYPWEKAKIIPSELNLEAGDWVIVQTDLSEELGIVKGSGEEGPADNLKIKRVATAKDQANYQLQQEARGDCLKECRKLIKKSALSMKLLEVVSSLDEKQLTFAFTAEGRIDFRELVRGLSSRFKRSIRMQQIGSRDEAKRIGGCGSCGRVLCCIRRQGNLPSITTEMARVQQIANRGAERISGQCGRLMCCLAYEAGDYKKMLSGMPEVYSQVKTPEGEGTVMEINAPQQALKIKLGNGKYVNLKKEDLI